MRIKGIAASPGIVIAKAFQYREAFLKIPRYRVQQDDIQLELVRLTNAIQQARAELDALSDRVRMELGDDQAAIFSAHSLMLDDPELHHLLQDKIHSELWNAESAVQFVFHDYEQTFLQLEDEYIRERAADVRDLAKRVLRCLTGSKQIGVTNLQEDVVLFAHDLTASDTAHFNSHIRAFVTEVGGRTSHSAIMARTLEIPAVVGVSSLTKGIRNHTTVIVDGNEGIVIVDPDQAELAEYEKLIQQFQAEKEELERFIEMPSQTQDGHPVELAVNIGTLKDIEHALHYQADGIGLFRTEFLYMDREALPTEEEQFCVYRAVLESMGKRPVVIRTLDIGGDKQLPYLDLPKEENPFLGYRAMRLCLDQPYLLKVQFRAIVRASAFGNVKIMYPMISTLEELQEANSLLESVKEELLAEGAAIGNYQVGIMMEVPSAAMIADLLAEEVDFFSIGTNDLIQYAMAADRMNEKVSYLYQQFHPAMLRYIHTIIEAAHQKGKWVGLCGEMASDPIAVPLLLGMGIDELSMSAGGLLQIKRLVSRLKLEEARNWAQEALLFKTEKQIRSYLEAQIDALLKKGGAG